MFTTNVGTIDRVLRVMVGLALLLWFFVDQTTGFWHYAKLIGILPLLTGLFATCPAYAMLGTNSCGIRRG